MLSSHILDNRTDQREAGLGASMRFHRGAPINLSLWAKVSEYVTRTVQVPLSHKI